MKIRIKGNSLRLRLVQAEVRKISDGKYIIEETWFGPNTKFTYVLGSSAYLTEPEARFDSDGMTVLLPATIAEPWYTNDQITIAHLMDNGHPGGLKLLIEKDFACLDHTDEDQSDQYPNPNRTC
jgi:hypothetical protein